MLEQGFLIGNIRHHRHVPKKHLFIYQMYWSLFDLDDLEKNASQYRFLSYEKWNILSFRGNDFYTKNKLSNKSSIISFIAQHTQKQFAGKVFLLSHIRFLGFNFNSVSFYFCINSENVVEYIVSEITNTPWGERHLYLHQCKEASPSGCHLFKFKKSFHISPFISMDMQYQWLFKFSESTMRIHMKVIQDEHAEKKQKPTKIIDVTFTGKHIPLTQVNINKMIVKHPFQPLKMVIKIYWQAFLLWFKRTPFYHHPKTQ